MMAHHSVMTSSLRIKNSIIDYFCDFSSDIDCNSRTYVFSDVIYLIINQCEPRRLQGVSGGHKVSASRAAQASEVRLLFKPRRLVFFLFVVNTPNFYGFPAQNGLNWE